VRINARETVTFDGQASNAYSSGAFSRVAEGAVGKGGDIEITTGSLLLTNGGGLSANTFGQGDAGSVFIRASDTCDLTVWAAMAHRVELEAQGWYVQPEREVVLTASTHVVTPQGQWLSPPECNPAQ
jgi:large exoprotein involved in heme utilization and adhesion